MSTYGSEKYGSGTYGDPTPFPLEVTDAHIEAVLIEQASQVADAHLEVVLIEQASQVSDVHLEVVLQAESSQVADVHLEAILQATDPGDHYNTDPIFIIDLPAIREDIRSGFRFPYPRPFRR
jgi:hypothetical protein